MNTTRIHMSCDVADNSLFNFLVTSHEGNTNCITIHGNDLDASIVCSEDQAIGLINELQKAIIRLEAYRKVQEQSNAS